MPSPSPDLPGSTQVRPLTRALSRLLQLERKQMGESPGEFAGRLGINGRMYRRLEEGSAAVRLSTLERVAAGLGCSASELLHRVEQLTME